MKNFTFRSISLCLCFFSLLGSLKSQQTLTQITGWNAYVHLPANYNSTSITYPTIIFFPGIGEIGTNASAVIANGPGAYITQGWNGNVVVDGNTVEFIVISIQPPAGYPGESLINQKIQTIKSLYRVDPNRLYLTGLSHGGWCSSTFVTGDAYGGPYTYASQIAAVVEVEGVTPDDNSPYPNLFDNFARSGGKFLGFEQINDNRGVPTRVNRMNATVPNSALYVQTNFGGGGHCCWNQFYGGQGTQPGVFSLGGVNQNLYQWLARQSLSAVLPPPPNQSPSANAGADIAITLPVNSATLNGSATDPDGTITGYSWVKISGPATGTLTNASAASATASGLVAGVYSYQLTVTDNGGATDKDTINVTVNAVIPPPPPLNQSPSANAGVDIAITLPVNSATLNGSATDPDGTITGYSWVKISGPATGTLTNASAASATASGLVAGVYSYQLTVTDNGGATDKDTINVTVNATANTPPVVGAGLSQNIALPVNTVTLSGTASDLDGSIATTLWTKLSGPAAGTIANPNSLTTAVNGLTQGTYVFQLTVTDNLGASASSSVNVTVNAFVAAAGCNPNAPVTHIITPTAPNEIYILNGYARGWKGGDTLKIPAGTYSVIEIDSFGGDPCREIIIMNSGGLVNVNGSMRIQKDVHHVKIIGNGYGGLNYGFKCLNFAFSRVNHFTMDRVEVGPNPGGVGIYGKQDPYAGQPWTQYPNYTSTKVTINNCYVHDVAGEGMYIGHTAPEGDPYNGGLIPQRMDSVTISNCTVTNTGWDGIQLSNARNGCLIFGNTVTNFGLIDKDAQRSGIISGGNTNSQVYNNIITNGTGNGIQIFGYGQMELYNNTITNVGYTANHPNGEECIYGQAYINNIEPNLKQAMTIHDNQLNYPQPFGAIRFWDNDNSELVNLYNNKFCFSSPPPNNWQQRYIALQKGFTNINNILSCTAGPNLAPTANAGTDITITLPTNTATVNGSGTDPDGTITAYLWQKISGPAGGTITNANASSSTITGLVTGVYSFQLTVTDNNGSTSNDVVRIIVNSSANQAPVANAGSNVNITLPTNTVTLNGSGTDADGTVTGYAWTKLSGPAATITAAGSATTTVTGLVAGTYQFQLTVTDNNAATATAIVTVTVNGATNQAPIAVAGVNQVITLPTNTVTLNGSGTDADGAVTGYAWTKLSGPAATITAAGSATTTITGLVAGTYQFQLTITDNNGTTGTDIVSVTVNAASNQAPIAVAGGNQVINLPTNSVTLNGSGTDADGTVTGYAWTKLSGPAATITAAGSASTTITGLVAGTYQFQLTVTDNNGTTGTDVVAVTVNAAANQAPIAAAGVNQVINLPTNTVTLNGSGTDVDGSVTAYAWTKLSGPAATITAAGSATTTVTGLVAGTYQFQLTVTDNNGSTDADIVTVIVNAIAPSNQAPIVVAGSNITITLPANSVTLNGSGTDADGSISGYSWTKVSGPSASISSTTSASTDITGLIAGTYQFMLTVTDDNGAIGTDIVVVTVNPAANQAPLANAGSNITITLPTNSVTLNGSGYDMDGSISSYSWTKLSGPAANIVSASSATTSVTGLVAGVYQFELEVTDNGGLTAVDIVTVTVIPAANQAPIAYAGIAQNINLPINSVTLSGSGTDPDGTIVSYSWSKLSGPAANIVSASSATTSVTGLVAGVYQFELEVTDNGGLTAVDIVTVTVIPAANQAPIAYAGIAQNINLPINSVTLSGSGTDPDGTIVSYSWSKLSGPAANIVSASSATTSVTGLVAGVYQFELEVTDNGGLTAVDIVTVTVIPAANQAPIAYAGIAQNINLPINSVTLSGSGTDPDGTIVSYSWSKLSGPAANIVSASSATTSVTGLVAGVYQFELEVTDNGGLTAVDIVTVTVIPAANKAPIAYAGIAQNINLPINSVTLSGSGTDPDGTIVSYSWSKLSGPAANIVSASSATTSVTGLVAGVYQFELEVTDNGGLTAVDIVTVTVIPAANQAPIAYAGIAQNINLPINSVTLSGSGTDPDGTIVSYSWSKLSGPAANIVSASSATTSVSGLIAGVYTFKLTVTDNSGATGTDIVTVTVNDATNQAPIANAGTNLNITLPTNSVILNGSGSDPDGSIVNYNWTKLSGPAANIVSASNASTTVSGLIAGVYVFELTVTDNSGAIATDVVTVTVNVAVNSAPIANAGFDRSFNLPVSNILLDGSGSYDPDGTIASYSWTKISGPNPTTVLNSTSNRATIPTVSEGVYEFELTVVDNDGAVSNDRVVITVLSISSVVNQKPIANAGSDASISLPAVTSALLDGSKSTDPDGNIVGYSWKQIAGPSTASIVSASIAGTTVNKLTAEGEYVFELTVTDDKGESSKDTVKISVVNTLRITQSIQLYPNPASDIMKLRLISDKTGKVSMKIYDVIGRFVMTTDLEKNATLLEKSINVTALKPGTYFLRLEFADGNHEVMKFMKQ